MPKATIFVESVSVKEGTSKQGKPYRFFKVKAEDGKEYASNDPTWQAKIGGPFEIEFTEKQNGKFVNYSIVDKPLKREYRPAEQKKVAEVDSFRAELRERLDIIEDLVKQVLNK